MTFWAGANNDLPCFLQKHIVLIHVPFEHERSVNPFTFTSITFRHLYTICKLKVKGDKKKARSARKRDFQARFKRKSTWICIQWENIFGLLLPQLIWIFFCSKVFDILVDHSQNLQNFDFNRRKKFQRIFRQFQRLFVWISKWSFSVAIFCLQTQNPASSSFP